MSFNNQGYRLYERLESFYLEYHKLLKEAMDFIDPVGIISVHTHDPDMEPFTLEGRKLTGDVILYN